jgi:hypothetical protein
MAPSEDFEIGTTSSTTNVESFTTSLAPPKSTYTQYSRPIPLASGGVRGGGWTEATWMWEFMTHDQHDQLRTFCSGKSATVYIRTRDHKGDMVYKTGIMIWPDGAPERSSTHIFNLEVRFVALDTFTP